MLSDLFLRSLGYSDREVEGMNKDLAFLESKNRKNEEHEAIRQFNNFYNLEETTEAISEELEFEEMNKRTIKELWSRSK